MAASLLLIASSFRAALLLRIGRRSESVMFQCGAVTVLVSATFFASVKLSVSSLSADAELGLIVLGHSTLVGAVAWLTKSPGLERFVPLLSAMPLPIAIAALRPYAASSDGGIAIVCWYAMACVPATLLVNRFAHDGELCVRVAQQFDVVCGAGASVLLLEQAPVADYRSFLMASFILVGGDIWWRMVNSDKQ